MSFFTEQRELQLAARSDAALFPVAGTRPGRMNGRDYPIILPEDAAHEAFYPPHAGWVDDYIRRHGITPHRMLRHLLSSQACCFNFLAPFVEKPDALAALLAPLFPGSTVEPCRMDETEGGYVAFEWVDRTDCLGEAGGRALTRGANCTSTDAAICARVDDRLELLLIEWKYTESYGARLPGGDRARKVRERRYGHLAFAEPGPIEAGNDLWLTDFFYEPFYQLMRQQILAWQVERSVAYPFDVVRVIHIAPKANEELTRVTSPELARRAGDKDAFALFSDLLVEPDRFRKTYIEDLFGGFDAAAFGMEDWQAWLKRRYAFAFAGGAA